MAENQVIISGSSMYKQVVKLPEQIEFALNNMIFSIRPTSKAIICGMGTCAIAGMVVADYMDVMQKHPLPVAKGIELPKWVDSDTTAIVISYSGDTDETLKLYSDAFKSKAQIVCITSGGALEDLCIKNGNILLSIPGGFQSRGAIGYMIGYILLALNNIGLINCTADVIAALPGVKAHRTALMALEENEAPIIAKRIDRRIPAIYSFFTMKSVAYRWKAQLNENSKSLSFYGTMPEFNHNELMGWTVDEMARECIPIVIFDDDVSEMLKAMAETPIGMILDRGMEAYIYHVKGVNHLEKMLKAILTGDFVSLYLAHEYGMDPDIPGAVVGARKRVR